MASVLRQVLTPLTSLFIFVLGNGYFSTLLALDMSAHNETTFTIGAMTGLYYLGLVCGSYKMERFIIRIGHIRAFSAFASMLAVLSMSHGIYYDAYFWLALRFFEGVATAGLFIVIESWLLCTSELTIRGQVLSLYMITFYAAQAVGQFFINIAHPQEMLLYAIAAMLCSLSVIPLSITRVPMPVFEQPSTISFKSLYQETASGIFGCFFSGMMLSAIYGLFPLYFYDLYKDRSSVSLLMFSVIFGGMILQYPVGKISDVIDRRFVVIVINILVILCSVLLSLSLNNFNVVLGLICLFGGLTFTVYPLSISHACDAIDSDNMVAAVQTLLLAYSIGAAIGPFVAPLAMENTDKHGLFLYFISISGVVVSLFIWRKTTSASPQQEEPFQAMPQTTPVMLELDPRTPESDTK